VAFFEFRGASLYAPVDEAEPFLRWEDGEWSGTPALVSEVQRAQTSGETVSLTPTGPLVAAHSPGGSRELARRLFSLVGSFTTDFPSEPPASSDYVS
jgi:hypothetical protein